MFEALEREDEWDAETDLSLGASGERACGFLPDHTSQTW